MTKKKVQPTRKTSQLRVAFDTSVLYTQEASDLLQKAARELIRNNSHHPDLTVKWYLPSVVRHEREYQMITRGFELLLPVQRLEKLLGHNLNITKDIVKQRVRPRFPT